MCYDYDVVILRSAGGKMPRAVCNNSERDLSQAIKL